MLVVQILPYIRFCNFHLFRVPRSLTGSVLRGNNVIHDFWYLGKGDEGDKILKRYTFYLFTLSINIH